MEGPFKRYPLGISDWRSLPDQGFSRVRSPKQLGPTAKSFKLLPERGPKFGEAKRAKV